eukprot:11857296-Heterocapsa_arctica.AAC.1
MTTTVTEGTGRAGTLRREATTSTTMETTTASLSAGLRAAVRRGRQQGRLPRRLQTAVRALPGDRRQLDGRETMTTLHG